MPADPAVRPAWLRSLHCTWPIRVTAEDARRSEMYLAERKARELKAASASYGDYLKGLGQHLVIEPLGTATHARVAQLHQRTNQFNLTTRRFNEQELAHFMGDSRGAVVLLGTVADRFGDHGIVVAGVALLDGATARIESLLMSCRVIGRQIEEAFLGAFIERLVARGCERIDGIYRPTAKNAMVRDYYASQGFTPVADNGEEAIWSWCKAADTVPGSPFVQVEWRE